MEQTGRNTSEYLGGKTSVWQKRQWQQWCNLGFKQTLWLAADKLRNNIDAAGYKHVVLGLIFLKYISDAFEEHRSILLMRFLREPIRKIQMNTGLKTFSEFQKHQVDISLKQHQAAYNRKIAQMMRW